MWSWNRAPWYLTKGVENLSPHKNLHVVVISFVHNCHKLEETKMSFSRWVGKSTEVHPNNEYYMALREMNYQEMRRQGGNLNEHYWVKVIKKVPLVLFSTGNNGVKINSLILDAFFKWTNCLYQHGNLIEITLEETCQTKGWPYLWRVNQKKKKSFKMSLFLFDI